MHTAYKLNPSWDHTVREFMFRREVRLSFF